MTRRVLLLTALLGVGPGGSATAAPPRAGGGIEAATAAQSGGCPRSLDCLTVIVPLDRLGAVEGTIGLRVAVSRVPNSRRAPVVSLSGGPGQSNRDFARDAATVLQARRTGRDTITFDQRGTGDSGLLRCPEFERRLRITFATPAGSCGRALGPRRSYFTSPDSAEDVEAIRVRIGAERIAVHGVSYGTKVALDYARRYPQRVERLVLDSPLEADGSDAFALATLEAVPRVLRTLCDRYGCGGAEGSPVGDMRRLAERLRSAPVRGRVRERRRLIPVELTADDLLNMLVSSDLFPGLMQRIPAAVRAALRGRPTRLLQLERTARRLEDLGPVRQFSPALFAATLCEESPTAWDRGAPPSVRRRQAAAALAALPEARVFPFDRPAARELGLLPLCADWPAPARAQPGQPPLPDVPVLIVSGELDLRTPLEGARRLAAQLPQAVLIRERAVGHSVLGIDPKACADRAVLAFLSDRALPGCGRLPSG